MKYLEVIKNKILAKSKNSAFSSLSSDIDVPIWLSDEMVNMTNISIDDYVLFPSVKYGVFPYSIMNKIINDNFIYKLFDIRDSIRVIQSKMVFCDAEDHYLFLDNFFNRSLRRKYKSKILSKFYNDIVSIFKLENSYKLIIDCIFLSFFTKTNSIIFHIIEKNIGDFMLSDKYENWINNCKRQISNYIETSKLCSDKFGEVFTPEWVIKEMVSLLPKFNKNMVFLDPAAGIGNFSIILIEKLMNDLIDEIPDDEERKKHILEKMIVQCELQIKNAFVNYYILDPENKYDLKIFRGSFISDDGGLNPDFNEKLKEWNINKFDVTLCNPPYIRNLHLKFLNLSYDLSDKLIFIHPNSWLVDEKCATKIYLDTKNKISKYIKKCTFIDPNSTFGIKLSSPVTITFVDKTCQSNSIIVEDRTNNTTCEYGSIHQINKWNNLNEYRSIKSKIDNYLLNNDDISKYYNKDNGFDYYINASRVRGNIGSDGEMFKSDFFTIITKDEPVKRVKDKTVAFNFKTELEATNFLNYLKTDFARFCLSMNKNDMSLNKIDVSRIPWLDFKLKWDDYKLYDYFQIDENEQEFIKKVIPNYYES